MQTTIKQLKNMKGTATCMVSYILQKGTNI